jgi:hypothetical protein
MAPKPKKEKYFFENEEKYKKKVAAEKAAKAKPSTKYSPAPMSDAAKRKASRAGAEKARQYTDLPARRPSPNPARTSYSPQQMTEFDKRKAAARGKATAAKTAPKKNIVEKIAGGLIKKKRK